MFALRVFSRRIWRKVCGVANEAVDGMTVLYAVKCTSTARWAVGGLNSRMRKRRWVKEGIFESWMHVTNSPLRQVLTPLEQCTLLFECQQQRPTQQSIEKDHDRYVSIYSLSSGDLTTGSLRGWREDDSVGLLLSCPSSRIGTYERSGVFISLTWSSTGLCVGADDDIAMVYL